MNGKTSKLDLEICCLETLSALISDMEHCNYGWGSFLCGVFFFTIGEESSVFSNPVKTVYNLTDYLFLNP